MALKITPYETVIGARVEGLDLNARPDPAEVAALEAALEHHGVLLFRDQRASPAQQIAFTGAFGPLAPTEEADARLPDHPEIFVVGNVGDHPVIFSAPEPDGPLEWHTDHSHRKEAARASLLYALEVPPAGGDTLFACMYSAYDSLPPKRQALCDGLRVTHSASGLRDFIEEQGIAPTAAKRTTVPDPPVERPLVRRHPVTGRKALYFGSRVSVAIVGWPDDEARAFIAELTEHACQEAFQYRHSWRAGDALFWDNRRLLHAGTPYDTEGTVRLMHRTTLRETEPIV